ncbi:PASTA domain-containing protein [Propionibacteriaceae bacterium Y2011]|uniref:PASTA domain-containing protein n=1 Tax=Microlunatus sp. Y2014 TaxID=3418488 RepID=UPI003B4BEDEF
MSQQSGGIPDPVESLMQSPAEMAELITATGEAVHQATRDDGVAAPGELTARMLLWLDPVLEAADQLSPLWRSIAASQYMLAPRGTDAGGEQSTWQEHTCGAARRRLDSLADLTETPLRSAAVQHDYFAAVARLRGVRPPRGDDVGDGIRLVHQAAPFVRDMARLLSAMTVAGFSRQPLDGLPQLVVSGLTSIAEQFGSQQLVLAEQGHSTLTNERAETLTALLRELASLKLAGFPTLHAFVPQVVGSTLKEARGTLGAYSLQVDAADGVHPPPRQRVPRLEGGWTVVAQEPAGGTRVPFDSTVLIHFAKAGEEPLPHLRS